jgi:dihydrofolate reductase
MKLTTTTNVSVDGVMQGLGGPDEDRRGGFDRGGRQRPPGPLFDDEAAAFLAEVYQRADAFLFGRRTYEIFAGYWGVMANSGNPIAAALNTRPKYVASTMLTAPQWADTTVLSGDVAAAVGELKAKPGGELQVHGSGNLVRWLLDNHLVDEITLPSSRHRRPGPPPDRPAGTPGSSYSAGRMCSYLSRCPHGRGHSRVLSSLRLRAGERARLHFPRIRPRSTLSSTNDRSEKSGALGGSHRAQRSPQGRD